MKKMIIMLVLGALAFAAQANIVNGDFEGQPFTNATVATSQLSGNPISGVLNKGWYTNSSTTLAIISGGVLNRQTGGAAQLSGAEQFFTDSQLGALSLKYDVQMTDANSSDKLYIQVFGYKYSTTFSGAASMSSTDSARIIVNSSQTPASSTAWTVTSLVNYIYSSGTLNSGNWLTSQTVAFSDLSVTSGEYDMYGIRILATTGAGDVIKVDNVSVIPEPATVGMLGLGALLTLLFRRMRR